MNINRILKMAYKNIINILATCLLIGAWTSEKFIIDGYNDKMENVRRQLVENTQVINGSRIADTEFAIQEFNFKHDSMHMNRSSYAMTIANTCTTGIQLITSGQIMTNTEENLLDSIKRDGVRRQAEIFRLAKKADIDSLMSEKRKLTPEVEEASFKFQIDVGAMVNSIGDKRDRAHWISLICYVIGISVLTLNNSFKKDKEDIENEKKYNTLVKEIRAIAHQKKQ